MKEDIGKLLAGQVATTSLLGAVDLTLLKVGLVVEKVKEVVKGLAGLVPAASCSGGKKRKRVVDSGDKGSGESGEDGNPLAG